MPTEFDFEKTIHDHRIDLSPAGIATLQVNTGKLCNQACKHCHVDAGPKRTEMMSKAGIERCLEILGANPEITTLDITGGAPELHEDFRSFVESARAMGKHIIVRHNLTVTLDSHPVTGASLAYLPEFFRTNGVELISSLPYFQEHETDSQRGQGVFEKSVRSMTLLNEIGYGAGDSGLILNLIYNPVGAYLPPDQAAMEAQFRKELASRHNLRFDHLYVITNMPINRFRHFLERAELYESYMERLLNAFNPVAAEGVMCRNMISVGFDGTLYDCDFNQMLEMKIDHGFPGTIWDFRMDELLRRRIAFGSHCFGCTAGAGSSCGGTTTGE